MADHDVMRYLCFLATQMDVMNPRLADPAFKAHCLAAFDWGVHGMHNPIAHLCSLPAYQGFKSVSWHSLQTEDSYHSIQYIAASLCRNNKKSQEDTQKLLAEVNLYKGPDPFLGTISDGGSDSLQGAKDQNQSGDTGSICYRQQHLAAENMKACSSCCQCALLPPALKY